MTNAKAPWPQGQDHSDLLCKRQEQVPIYEAKGSCDTATPRALPFKQRTTLMSPTVNNFVHDLVAMAKAMEDLPVVQAQADELARQNNELAHSVQAREESILKLKAEIDALHTKVRSTEAERDDAELRFLESEDRTRSALDFIKTTFGSAGSLIQALEPPPKVEPVAQAEPEVKHEEPLSAAPSSAYALDGTVSPGEQHPYYNAAAQGQSETNPHVGDPISGAYSPQQQGTDVGGVGAEPSHSLPVTSFEEVPKSDVNPPQDTASGQSIDSGPSATYSGASTTENASVSTTTDSAVDDVGYHNEPDVGNDWSAWNAWCERMRQRYGTGAWPQRPDNAAPSVA